MSKKLVIVVEVEDDAVRGRIDAEALSNLFCGIDTGALSGRIVSADYDDPPIVAELSNEGDERAYTNVATVGDLRRFIDGLPDSARFESYSGSVESLVNFGLSYGPGCDDYYDKDKSFVLTVNNEN
jgi:hypothetical protein